MTWSSPGGPTPRWTPPWRTILGDAEVVVDFSQPDTALENARLCLEAGVHCVMGTTGADFSELEGVGSANLFVAPNFAIGAVLMMEASKLIAPHMPECEIVELHHDQKLDAPSGTAARTADLIGEAGGNVHEPIHSVRLRGLVAHQEVLFGGRGADALDPPRLDLAGVLHARRAAGGAEGRVAWSAHPRSGSRRCSSRRASGVHFVDLRR